MTPLPSSIDEVIDRLRRIVADCAARGDRNGYFAALYLRMTLAVRDGIRNGEFADGPRMERLDVLFAGRYLAAWEQYRSGELPSRCWLRAFSAAEASGRIVLQYLLAGINAHINLDLGVAAARTCPGNALAGLRGDFDRINDVLARLTPTVEGEIDRMSPVLERLTGLFPRLDLRVVGFSLDRARAEAWRLAEQLAPLDPLAQLGPMAGRDLEVSLIADGVLAENPVTRAVLAHESQDVPANIERLAGPGPELPLPSP